MEIETTNEIKSISPLNEDQLKYLRELLGLKIKQEDLCLFQDMNDLSLFINNLKFADKKKNEIKDKISEEVKKIPNLENVQKLSEDKNKKFSEVVKLNGKTTIYHTAEKDELSQTMHAFYFCDKSKQIFSDKQAAEYRAMHFDTGYELPLSIGFGTKKEEDNISSYSNLKQIDMQNDNIENKNLNKKRKPNNNFNGKQKSSKKQRTEKMNASDDYNNSKNGEGLDVKEEEYCIPKCKYGRKSHGEPMIQCDKCKEWYHTKCLSFTHEQFQKYDVKGKAWFCPKCSKMDIEEKKNLKESLEFKNNFK